MVLPVSQQLTHKAYTSSLLTQKKEETGYRRISGQNKPQSAGYQAFTRGRSKFGSTNDKPLVISLIFFSSIPTFSIYTNTSLYHPNVKTRKP